MDAALRIVNRGPHRVIIVVSIPDIFPIRKPSPPLCQRAAARTIQIIDLTIYHCCIVFRDLFFCDWRFWKRRASIKRISAVHLYNWSSDRSRYFCKEMWLLSHIVEPDTKADRPYCQNPY